MPRKPIYAQLHETDTTPITDDAGNIIAWGDKVCAGPNPACKRAYNANRTYHIIPAHTDPRAEIAHLALPSYHYASREEAIEALENGWNTAVTVDNPTDRDAAYAKGIPVRILKGTGRF